MASIRCPECEEKVKLPADEERATVRCSSCGFKIRLEEPEDEDEEPVRRKKKKKRAKNFFAPYLSMAMRLDTSLKVIVGLTIVAVLASCIHPVLYMVPIIYGLVLMVIGSLMFAVIVFNDSPMEFLMCMFLPFYSLYYLITHWGETRAAFLLQIYGVFVCFSFICAVPFHAVIFGTVQLPRGNLQLKQRAELSVPAPATINPSSVAC